MTDAFPNKIRTTQATALWTSISVIPLLWCPVSLFQGEDLDSAFDSISAFSSKKDNQEAVFGSEETILDIRYAWNFHFYKLCRTQIVIELLLHLSWHSYSHGFKTSNFRKTAVPSNCILWLGHWHMYPALVDPHVSDQVSVQLCQRILFQNFSSNWFLKNQC